MDTLGQLLDRSAAHHHHLCPRQVLGVRIGMRASVELDLDLPQKDQRLFAFVECDGCGMGGIAVATGCWVDRRTLRVLDYGKLAATFVDTYTGQAVRIHPHPESRLRAVQYAPEAPDRWHCQRRAYQIVPDEELLIVQPVHLTVSLDKIISKPGMRVVCDRCGEEISNEREVQRKGLSLCRACAGDGYYIVPEKVPDPGQRSIRWHSKQDQLLPLVGQ
jgi:formylmethanofuran dehydrogenase subunit E